MKAFNATLPKGSVVVAIDHRYNDNDGPYSVAWVWDGVELTCETYANGYNGRSFDDADVDAKTTGQILLAAEAYAVGKFDLGRLCSGSNTYIDCVVKLKGSRKAPNNVELLVVDHENSYYDSSYNRRVDAKIQVQLRDERVWVNQSCINEIVKGAYPFWKPEV